MDSKIILPLDHLSWKAANEVMNKTKGMVWGYKIRSIVFEKGLKIIGEIKKYGNVMLDFKLFDIPSAMTESIKQHFKAGADITTVHCTSSYRPKTEHLTGNRIAGVTILTSMVEKDFNRFYRGDDIFQMVKNMAGYAARNYEFLVCSAQDLPFISHFDVKKICPGIRPSWYPVKDDQKRTATPYEAMKNGADLLVIGRPLLNAADIPKAVEKTNEEITKGLLP